MDDPGVESAYFDVPGARGVPIYEWARLSVDWSFNSLLHISNYATGKSVWGFR